MKFFEFIEKALSEVPGEPSHMRVSTFYIIIILTTAIALGFICTVFWFKEFIISYLGMIIGLVITALGAKIWQKDKEQ